MKRILLSLSILMVGLVFPYESSGIARTPGLERHWAYESIGSMVEKDIYPSSIINLNQFEAPITRAEASSIFAKFMEDKQLDVPILAKDLELTGPHYNAMKRLIQNGVIHNSETIRPNDFLTKAEAAKLVMHTFRLKEDENYEKTFSDVSNTYWARKYIETLADVSIIKGNLKGEYQPYSAITYAELSALLNNAMRFEKQVENNEIIYNNLTKDYLFTENDFPLLEQEIITLINDYRLMNHVLPLQYDPKLTQLGIIKVDDMIRHHYFDHYSPIFHMPWELAGLFNYEFHTLGENLARNFICAKDVVDAWIASPSHRDNMLKEQFEYIGIGIKSDAEGYLYFSNLFSGK